MPRTARKLPGGMIFHVLNGLDGQDSLNGLAGNDTINAGDGDDTIDGGVGNDSMSGGDGFDLLTYATRTGNLVVTLDDAADDGSIGEIDNARADIEDVEGGSGNDFLSGNSSPNGLYGGAGNDTLLGGIGDDLLDGGTGTDSILGGDGIDTASYAGRTENLVITLDGLFNDGAAGENDKLGADIENAEGGEGNDSITGNSDGNQLFGAGGDDTILGLTGDDSLAGGDGNDSIDASDGNDSLDGGTGSDTVTAGTGDDYIDIGDSETDTYNTGGDAGDELIADETDIDANAFSAFSTTTTSSPTQLSAPANVRVVRNTNGSAKVTWWDGDARTERYQIEIKNLDNTENFRFVVQRPKVNPPRAGFVYPTTLATAIVLPNTTYQVLVRGIGSGLSNYGVPQQLNPVNATLPTPSVTWRYNEWGSAVLTWAPIGTGADFMNLNVEGQFLSSMPWTFVGYPTQTFPSTAGTAVVSVPKGTKLRFYWTKGTALSPRSGPVSSGNQPPYTLAAVSGLSATLVPNTTNVTVSWTHTRPADEIPYTGSYTIATWNDAGTFTLHGAPPSARSITLNNVGTGINRKFAVFATAVRSFLPTGPLQGVSSATVSGLTGGSTAIPAAPNGLSAQPITANKIGLVWNNVPNNEDGYEIQRQRFILITDDSGTYWGSDGNGWGSSVQTTSDAPSWIHSNVQTNEQFQYQVRSLRTSNDSITWVTSAQTGVPDLWLDNPIDATEGAAGTAVGFTVRTSFYINVPTVVRLSRPTSESNDGSENADMGPVPTSVTIPAGATSVSFSIPVINDNKVEFSGSVVMKAEDGAYKIVVNPADPNEEGQRYRLGKARAYIDDDEVGPIALRTYAPSRPMNLASVDSNDAMNPDMNCFRWAANTTTRVILVC